MQKLNNIKPTMILLMMVMLFSCKDDDMPHNPGDPINLQINVTFHENAPNTVVIQAQADNAVKYELWLPSATQAHETNTTGYFEITFIQSGNYTFNIRAYGSSGRYLNEMRVVEIMDKDPVPIDLGYTTPMQYEGYELVWQDEFNGTTLNTNDWVYEIGDGCPSLCGWGNNELQYYRRENVWVADGTLIIEARNENFGNRNYTSSRIKTQGKQSFQYGRIDIRALLPVGQGIWPALWMLGNDISSVGWPRCGEIDIMEMIGGNGRENTVHGTLHWHNNSHASAGNSYRLPQGIFADKYHVFTITWDETFMRWFVNDIQFGVINITPDHMTEFHQPFFFIFNVAVGGIWPGNPDQTTEFNQQMKVDYVRVFKKIND